MTFGIFDVAKAPPGQLIALAWCNQPAYEISAKDIHHKEQLKANTPDRTLELGDVRQLRQIGYQS